jgi:hypothetical protein
MNKLAILKMSKKKIIGAVCVIAAFAGGAVVGAQIYANASNNAVAVLPVAKGGTGQNDLAAVLGVGSANKLATARTINGTNFDGTQNINIDEPVTGNIGWNSAVVNSGSYILRKQGKVVTLYADYNVKAQGGPLSLPDGFKPANEIKALAICRYGINQSATRLITLKTNGDTDMMHLGTVITNGEIQVLNATWITA